MNDQLTSFQKGYHCYYAGGNRGDCRFALDSQEYADWHEGYTLAETEDV
jgi:hypothetical protein